MKQLSIRIAELASACMLCHDAPCAAACPKGLSPDRFVRSVRFANGEGALAQMTGCVGCGACERACIRPDGATKILALMALAEQVYPAAPAPEADLTTQMCGVPCENPLGKISCHPNIHTIIPDLVKFTLDARHQDPAVVQQCIDIIKKIPSEVEKCAFSYEEAWSRATVAFHKPYVDFVEESAKELGYPSMRMYSGPGHDAQFAADIVPTTMIFVPSGGGHSHCELEHTPVENCKKGADVLLNTVLKIDAAV